MCKGIFLILCLFLFVGPVFGHKDFFKGLAIFFDTFPNGNHEHSFPYVSAMLGDGSLGYDHVNDNKASVAGHGCEANVRGSSEPVKARLTYYKNHILQVSLCISLPPILKYLYIVCEQLSLSGGGSTEWQTCFVLSNVTLPEPGYIGVTARTGELFDNHDILKLETFVHIRHDEYIGTDAVDSHIHDDSAGHVSSGNGGSLFGALLRLTGMGVVAAIAFMVYRAYSKKNMKRF